MSVTGPTIESSLLLTLAETSQLVSHCHDPHETLTNIVRLIQERFHTAVCSVYLMEPERGELVLGATVGLKPESVGRVRMRLDEGLTGLVAQKKTPVMVDDAFQHPRFKYFAEAGEDPYHSFLGVPLIAGGELQGVLVVQTPEPHTFSSNEVRMLVTVGSQLAPLVSDVRLLERVIAAAHADAATPAVSKTSEVRCGAPLSPGMGFGLAYVINGFEEWAHTTPSAGVDIAVEKERLARAMEAAHEEITRQSRHISELVGEDHGAILQAQLLMMQDRAIERDLALFLDAGASAETALTRTLEKYVAAFQKLATPFFKERVYDIKDVFRRLLWHLRPPEPANSAGNGRLVLLAHEASVMGLFSVDLDRLAAVVVEHGGPQSHAAILARSLGIPMVGQVPDLLKRVEPGRPVLVDGTTGTVHLDPGPEVSRVARPESSKGVLEPRARHSKTQGVPADQLPRLEANINLLHEARHAVEHGAAGVGLFRSEFLFLARRTLPTEEEQVAIYHKLLDRLAGRPVSIRTFDLRADKASSYGPWAAGGSTPFDWRRVLESPSLQQLFKDQVRAILRAAAFGPARILIPLVTRTEQLDFVLETIGEARAELNREGLEFGERVPLGIMLESAAAITMADVWGEQVDYFALGTNDLAASALGLDRNDPSGAAEADPLHPGFLRLIADVVSTAHQAGRPVTVCGEMAADSEATVVLAALGVDALSVAVPELRFVRRTLSEVSPEKLAEMPRRLRGLRTAEQVRRLLRADVA
jgi:phosphotransferase system, enzyme I, PtsP